MPGLQPYAISPLTGTRRDRCEAVFPFSAGGDVGFVCRCASQHILLFELFDQTRVFLFDAFMIPGTAISAPHIRLDLRGNGDVP
jgi:hypothetical protein